MDWARLLLGICEGLDAIHKKGYLHNDIKSDNIILSDIIPKSNHAPLVWPIIIDFGKARSIQHPKTYKLSEKEKLYYLETYTHLAPELVSGEKPESIATDMFSIGIIFHKVAAIANCPQLKSLSRLLVGVNSTRPSMLYMFMNHLLH